jgi:hypothetical protein
MTNSTCSSYFAVDPKARKRAENYLLERRIFRSLRTGKVIEKRWPRFSFPMFWHYDVLRGLDYLRNAGIKPDSRVRAEPPTANPNKYSDELLDAYVFVEDADAFYAEYAARGVEFTWGLANMPWHSREFVVKVSSLKLSDARPFLLQNPKS